jgi:ubiquinone/menaquinone biosynthesis C-methylase UbiE
LRVLVGSRNDLRLFLRSSAAHNCFVCGLASLAIALAALSGPTAACAQDEFASDASRLATALKLHAGQTVADIGAGRGRLALELAQVVGPSGRVYATELDADRLRDLRKAAEDGGTKNVSVVEAHATETNLPEACCDALVLRRVYHHIDDPGKMNASLLRSLKPGGLLAVIDFTPDSAESEDPGGRDSGNQHGVTPETVTRELGQAGFDSVRVAEQDGTDRFMVVARRPTE